MIEFGNTLRAAREAKGCTIAQIAEATHLAPATIEDLEREDFTRIPAPIYGRGFVKLYCEAVGLDPKPLVAEFMDIFNGKHDTAIKERPAASAPKSAEPANPEPAQTPKYETDLFGQQAAAEPEPPPAPFTTPEPPPVPEPITAPEPPPAPEPKPIAAPKPPPMDDLFAAAEPPPEPRLSRYAAPVSQSLTSETTANFLSPSLWRITILACTAIVLLWLGFLGLRALYRATSTTNVPSESDDVAATEPSEQAKPTKQTPSPRTPQNIPALYID